MRSTLTAFGATAAAVLLMVSGDNAMAQANPDTRTGISASATASPVARATASPIASPTASAIAAAEAASATTTGPAADGPPAGWFGPPPGWSGGMQVGGFRSPDFEGSRTSRNQPLLGAIFTYRSQQLGSIEMGSRGLQWTFVLDPKLSLAAGLSVDPGRIDDDRKRLTVMGRRPGSERLSGLGDIAITPLLGFSANGTLGTWGTLGTAAGLGGLKWNAMARRAATSHEGTLVDAGIALPWTIGRHAKFSFGPSITWADRRYTQAYFGVTPDQARASGRPVFEAGAGTKSLQWTLDMDMALSRHWSVIGILQAKQLKGDAARSPITERRHQTAGMLAAQYQFQL